MMRETLSFARATTASAFKKHAPSCGQVILHEIARPIQAICIATDAAGSNEKSFRPKWGSAPSDRKLPTVAQVSPSGLESQRRIQSDDPLAHGVAVVEGPLVIASVIAELRADLPQGIDVVADADRVAGVEVRESRSFALLIFPDLVADRQKAFLRELELGVVEHAVSCGIAWNERAQSAAAEAVDRSDARGAAHVRVELPHVIGFGVGVDAAAVGELVGPRADDVVE